MHSANSIIACHKKFIFFITFSFFFSVAFAQENSPYSRYGLGDLVPAQNMVSRGMGGISAGFIDSVGFLPYSQSINLTNPAALGSLNTTLFDVGGEIDRRTLKSNTNTDKYTATNTLISYLQLGFPITPKRMLARHNAWGISFGLRPATRINYKIQGESKPVGVDSITTLYEGNGGINQANFSTGIRIKNFSFGISTGYTFGNRETGTKIGFINDSVRYMQSNTEATSRFGGGFLNAGLQYAMRLKNSDVLRFGLTANLEQKLKGKRNYVNETFVFAQDGSIRAVDTINATTDQKGSVVLPASYSAGFTYTNAHWIFGADLDYATWSRYRYFGEKDPVQDNVTFHVGAQYYPANINTVTKKYWSFVKYRAGFYYGNDYVKINTTRPQYALTLGAGLPLTSFRRLRFGDFATLNTGIEAGRHGVKGNTGIREGILRIHLGLSFTAAWFQKRKYD